MSYIPPPSTLPPGSPVWAYLRDSGGPTQGESIDRQRSEIEAYCLQHGLRLVHVFADEARSGGSVTGREQFDEMLSASARSGHPSGLLVWDFARFSRNVEEAGYYKAVLRRAGIVIHSLMDVIPEGPYSRIVEVIVDIANEEKRHQTKRDTASGLRRIVETYGAMPGTPPIGYMRQPITVGTRRDGSPHILSRWVPDPDVAPLVLRAFELRAQGATHGQIRKATGLFQSRNSYTTFFCNSIYKGEAFYSGKTYPVEPIVTPELWEAAQRLGQLRGRDRYGPQSRRSVVSPYLLSGFVICQECGSPLYGYEVMGERKYYVCNRARRRHDCHGRHVPAGVLEAGVVAKVLDEILVLENLLKVQSALKDEWRHSRRELDQLEDRNRKELATVQKQIRHYTDAIGRSGSSRALLDALHTAEQERDQLEYKIEHAPIPPASLQLNRITLSGLAEQIRSILLSDDLAERKTALRMIIHRILVRRTDAEILALIEYHLPETNIPPDGGKDAGGEFSKTDLYPPGAPSVLLNIPIPKYSITRS